jgi:hypothetical protein
VLGFPFTYGTVGASMDDRGQFLEPASLKLELAINIANWRSLGINPRG